MSSKQTSHLTLILGGARSGKSSYAGRLAEETGKPVTFLATAQALDQEMSARIHKHRLERPAHWETLELPFGIASHIPQIQSEVVVLDCLTLLVSNWLMEFVKDDLVEEAPFLQAMQNEVNGLIVKLRQELDASVPGVRCVVKPLEQGPPINEPIQIRVSGENLDKLRLLADQVGAELRAAGGYHVFDDLGLRTPNIQIDIDQDRANSLGLNNRQIGGVALSSFAGLQVTELREKDRLIPVLVRGRIEDRSEVEKIRGLYAPTPDGKSVPFESFAKVIVQPEFVRIPHYNQLRTVTVKAYAPFGELPSQVLDRARPGLAKIKLDPGYELKFAGEDEELALGMFPLLYPERSEPCPARTGPVLGGNLGRQRRSRTRGEDRREHEPSAQNPAAARRLAGRARFVWIGPADEDKPDRLDGDAAGVTFLGLRHDMPALYAAMDVFVLASWREGFSRSAMEAAASGCALVLSDIRGCREIGRHQREVLLVPPRDPVALAAAVGRLLDDPRLRDKLASAAMTRALETFDQRRVAGRSLAAYRAVAERKGLVVMVGMTHRYRPDAQAVRSFIQSGELGEIDSVRASWHVSRPARSPLGWRTRKDEAGGGAMLDLGLTMVDLCLWLTGNPTPKRVSANLTRPKGERGVEHSGSAFIVCEEGIAILVDVTWRHIAERERFGLGVRGSKGEASARRRQTIT